MKGVAKKNFSSGRDDDGKLIQFEQGKEYDLSKFSKEKVNKISHLFDEPKQSKKKEE